MKYGKRLRILRKEKRWTLQEASNFLNIASSTLAGYEREFRKPSLDILAHIAKMYNVSTDYILGLTDDREIKKVSHNVHEYFKKDNLNYKGVPVSSHELEPIEKILDVIIEERLTKKHARDTLSEENPDQHKEKEYYVL